AANELEKAARGEDKAEIDAKTQALIEASKKLVDMAQQQQAAGAGQQTQGAESAQSQDDVVDADFKEVNDDKK
ncbi:MAG: molecular chaperone DnaK, partial [Candidatus Schmidhempelia sp.]|nr:molecular chaperone DnaK [Candidatus Schmidhempelia sp.]